MKKANKILLVYPGSLNASFPELPLPLLYLSHALQKAGFSIDILDMRLQHYKTIDPREYMLVGISTATGPTITKGLELAAFVRSQASAIPIVWGGVHPSLLPEQTLQHPLVDVVVKGEGEATMQELAVAIRDGTDLAPIKGIGYKRNGTIQINQDREFINLDEIDIALPYELFAMDRYAISSFPMHTSRGCPYRCGFCYNLGFNKRKWRCKNAVHVVDEVQHVMERFGITHITFTWEDEFFINTERVRQIAEELLRRNITITWDAFCRFNHFYKFEREFIELLERSGCVSLSFGAESGSQRILNDVVNKDITIDHIITTTEKLKNTTIRQIVSFISGLPTETDEDMRLTYDLMERLYAINPRVYLNGLFLYTPYPGTPLFDLVKQRYGYQMPRSFEEWGKFKIFRGLGITWHSKQYINKYKTISILTRFPFYFHSFRFGDVKSVIGGERFAVFPYNLIYYLFTKSAQWRWRHKQFRFPVEWLVLEKVVDKVRGFV
jgi:radical SAM superfamily enzyme YgiQ (UPF0313 family)